MVTNGIQQKSQRETLEIHTPLLYVVTITQKSCRFLILMVVLRPLQFEEALQWKAVERPHLEAAA